MSTILIFELWLWVCIPLVLAPQQWGILLKAVAVYHFMTFFCIMTVQLDFALKSLILSLKRCLLFDELKLLICAIKLGFVCFTHLCRLVFFKLWVLAFLQHTGVFCFRPQTRMQIMAYSHFCTGWAVPVAARPAMCYKENLPSSLCFWGELFDLEICNLNTQEVVPISHWKSIFKF